MNAFWWTGAFDILHYLYRFSDNAWLWYEVDSNDPRWMFNLKTGSWEQQ